MLSLQDMNANELQTLKNKYDIIGNDPALNRALEIAVGVAATDITVLITGESGVGKENLPKIIHQNSRRKTGKYFAINCGAIPEGTIDSELFGHEKGSFTGANEMRKGYFEEADGGTLFLDEIGELPLASQAKLLRVLQSGEFIRVGSSKVLKTDVRVVAATNVNLQHKIARGKFREDLYYRLCAVNIIMPALRERQGDIYTLFRKFASDFSDKYNTCKISLTEDAVIMLRKYRWPGNIRQLKNVAETLSAIESSRVASVHDKCEVNALVLAQYLPKEDTNLLPVKAESHEYAETPGEREAIIRALYQLRQDVDYLKGVIAKSGMTPNAVATPIAAPADETFVTDFSEEAPEEQDIEPVSHADPVTSIKQSNLSLIESVLAKHNGNRRAAAAELGISERTLYRKIQELNK